MTTAALFDEPARPVGKLRTLIEARCASLRASGHDLDDDLVLVVASLADRIDAANAGGDRRGFVMLTAEYRAARRDLFEGLDDAGDDGFAAAVASFRAATADDTTGHVPAH